METSSRVLRGDGDAEINDEAAVDSTTTSRVPNGRTIVNTAAKSHLLYTGDCEKSPWMGGISLYVSINT